MLLSGPERPKPHSEKKLDGDGRRASETKRLGSAEMGVSMLLLLLYAVLFCVVVPGGGGRANGFGGPWAPALRIAPADGDGGGNTTPLWFVSALALAGVRAFPAESRDVDSAVALPRSEFSLGICTFNCGRFGGNCPLFARDGGLMSLTSVIAGTDCDFCESRGAGCLGPLASTDSSGPGSFLTRFSLRGDSTVGPIGKCLASTDPRSSMGVKMLRDLDDTAFGCGGD